jgi:hypothetical protein
MPHDVVGMPHDVVDGSVVVGGALVETERVNWPPEGTPQERGDFNAPRS